MLFRSKIKPKVVPGREDEVVTRLVEYTDGTPFDGKPVKQKTKWSKQKTGRVAENVMEQYLRQYEGWDDAAHANSKRSNFPVDLTYDHMVVEVKGGSAANLPKSQQWRLTIGEMSDKEKAEFARMSGGDKAKANALKQKAILERKAAAMDEMSRRTGKKVGARTMTAVVDADTRTVDIYSFDGFHQRIDWTSDMAREGYIGTFGF